ncbi:MAG: hypothetical protein H6838_07145 [Planctomycetes bacterium]|nr:hypothetical protein [Planctomycetota bacterium]MCB9885250.1 hypothetical protein [Planctomycetota bacterium]
MTLATLLCLAASLSPQGPVDVEVTPAGKPAVTASWRVPKIVVDTDFGSATVDPDKLEQILFGDPDVVVAAGTELRGKVKLGTVEAKVDGKTQRFATRELESLVVLREGSGGKASFAGAWMTSFGPAELQQRGLTVTGTYGFDSKGKIEGKLDKGALEFTYRDSNSSGSGRWELLPEDGAFTGNYDDNKGFWGGYRRVATAAPAKPGEITSGQTDAGMRYHVHWPKDYKAGAKMPAICILHGSNMDGLAYVNTIAVSWPKLAERYLIVGFDGERLSQASKAGALRFNYTYVNFGGPEVGPAWAHRQSPALVADSLQQLGKDLSITRWFLGGHSQGGFLSYAMLMFYPELLAGAFPMSCNLLVQCEPGNFDAAAQAKQHRVPVAVMHGERDQVVDYESGVYCNLRMIDGDFPFVRFFHPDKIGHQFGLMPVDEAIAWLDAASSDEPERLVAFAEKQAEDMWWRDVGATLTRLRELRAPASLSSRIDAVAAKLEKAAAEEAGKLRAAIEKDGSGKWIDEWLEWRTEYATSRAAEPAVAAYAALRKKQEKRGDELFGEWRGSEKKDRATAFDKIAAEAFATRWYPAVKLWTK